MGEPEEASDDESEDIFAIAAEHYALDYEARISCLWPFVIIPLLAASAVAGIAYLIYGGLSR